MRTTPLAAVTLACLAIAWAPTGAAANPWLERRVLHIAHQGGELEAPSNTMYAFRTALSKGADMLELDVHATADRELVVLHDATVDRTTNGSGRVDELSLAEIQALDAAYWFVPGRNAVRGEPDDAYVWRGVATGAVEPPEGYTAGDFRIPTLREVLTAFPDVPINIEIKATAPDTAAYEAQLAAVLAEFGRVDDVIVASFLDHAMEAFKLHAPDVHTAAATGQTAAFWTSVRGPAPGAPNPRYQALQVPLTFEGVEVVTPAFIAKAHANGLAVHVWTIDDAATMHQLLDWGVDGIMTARPTVLEQVLAERDAPRPG